MRLAFFEYPVPDWPDHRLITVFGDMKNEEFDQRQVKRLCVVLIQLFSTAQSCMHCTTTRERRPYLGDVVQAF